MLLEFVRLSDGAVVTEPDIDPGCSIPSAYFRPDRSKYLPVREKPQPEFDRYSQKIVKGYPEIGEDGEYLQKWNVVDLEGDELDQAQIQKQIDEATNISNAKNMLIHAVREHLDAVAATRGYDSILALCSYSASGDSVFAQEAAAGIAWRDAVWRCCYDVIDQIEAGSRPMPNTGELVSELPEIGW